MDSLHQVIQEVQQYLQLLAYGAYASIGTLALSVFNTILMAFVLIMLYRIVRRTTA